jgi:hypothetical protein
VKTRRIPSNTAEEFVSCSALTVRFPPGTARGKKRFRSARRAGARRRPGAEYGGAAVDPPLTKATTLQDSAYPP